MPKNLITSLIILLFVASSCANTRDSISRGLSGKKKVSSDEFLVQKKDPLIMPPDYDSLPTPTEIKEAQKEISNFEKKLQKSVTEDSSSSASSTEESILKQIQNN